MQNIFEISNLTCKYTNNNNPVIKVEKLSLLKGEITIILGLSGTGKSTLLETLGLMNNTLLNESSVKFINGNETFNYDKLWHDHNQEKLSNLRKMHFSFIFQNTNLMHNFTVYENICMTQMLQGYSMSSSYIKAKEIMEVIGLGHISKTKKAFELSGGERQRVAFARAILPDFSVLFGDEPTGNLDEYNSYELMKAIRKSITGTDKAAIIVSHDINLALDFADRIVLISKDANMGTIKSSNVYSSDKSEMNAVWKNSSSVFSTSELIQQLKIS